MNTWGKPDKINTTLTSKITQEQWVYGSRYVYFDGNRLSAFNCEQTVIICDGWLQFYSTP
jgi:hypothetical protein